ncbi:hypothetical protein MUN88_17075 [Gracilibacillus caseinilyticus]|uniref:Major capsid protein n=1 Tax=Gracilibacillus caseinilyticus TaxID=2932256 RepID=A0ABY4ETU1_9BACI|nr:hypothetical protein [Gracilibacillus caseinilyticus]UOQ47745.1 hypothetical protein MUN88_17075 [Gracilibacillus caseinilyticus]
MAVNTFLKTVWEARLLTNYSKASIAEVITTAPSSIEGKTMKFNKAGAVNVKDYTGTVAWDEIDTTDVDLTMDQQKYFAFTVNDVDAVQAAGDLVDGHVQNASTGVQEETDSFVLGLYTDAHADNTIGTDAAPESLTKDNVYDFIVDLGTKLNKKKAPKTDRYVTINSDVLGLLSKDDRFTRQPVVLENGIVEGQKINGLQVVVSEELNTTDGTLHIVANHKGAIGYGKQIDEMEAMRLESKFADGIRGLAVYGGTVLRPEGVAVLTATIA